MATKPVTTPQVWAFNAVYTTGPFIGSANKAFPAIWADGHRPGAADPTAAEYQNYQQFWTDSWTVDWLTQGSATASTDTHIVETDANGRTEQRGYDLVEIVDQTVANWTAANTVVPAFLITTGGGGGVQVTDQGLGAAFSADKSGFSGQGFLYVDDVLSSADAFVALPQGSGAIFSGVALSLNTRGVEVTTWDNPALIADTLGTAATIRMVPKAPPAAPVAGDMVNNAIDNNLHFWDNTTTERVVWSTEIGIVRQIYNSASLTPNVVANFNIINQNFPFVAGKRYTVRATLAVGRPAASTQIPTIVFSIGASLAPANGSFFWLFQAGANYVETVNSYLYDFVSPATGVLNILLGTAAGVGAGNLNFGDCSIEILGAFD
jgi:hypothetical protein